MYLVRDAALSRASRRNGSHPYNLPTSNLRRKQPHTRKQTLSVRLRGSLLAGGRRRRRRARRSDDSRDAQLNTTSVQLKIVIPPGGVKSITKTAN